MSLVLLKLGDMPLWFVAALLSRDLLILAGGMYLKSSRGVVLPSNLTGKWTATIIAFTILMLLMNVLPEAKPILLAACTAGLLVSFSCTSRDFSASSGRPEPETGWDS